MSDLDFKRGLGGDVRRDGEEIPTCRALPGSELDLKGASMKKSEGMVKRSPGVTPIICKRDSSPGLE